ncbi:MAG: TM2 domain-containing protein [Clostridia bacterium]|nr:TM2 domain-containing protein [Clostridia bacterium]
MFCRKCGKEMDDNAQTCPNCGEPAVVKATVITNEGAESIVRKGWFLAIMCFFFGALGVHRFMVGKIGTGVLWLLTGGLFGIGVLVDFIMILCSSFTDKDGEKIPLA